MVTAGPTAQVRRRTAALVASVAAAVGLAACGGSDEATAPRAPGQPVTIAFAGDVHFAGQLAGRLDDPATAMGPMAATLAEADLAVVNLETAVTGSGAPQPKQFTFRAPPSAFIALKDAGVDVVTMANNHALDYGAQSATDALAAAKDNAMPVVGLGADDAAAFAPWVTTIKGQRIAVFAATAVLDDGLRPSWTAAPGHPGLATALDGDNLRLVAAVRKVRPDVDTVVVDVHYGSDLKTCPTKVQRELASDLVAVGADIVVGQHAHVLLGGGYLGKAYVHYGLGNFQFYVSGSGATSKTGVLTLTATGRDVSNPRWQPGRIVGGLPTPLTGDAAAAATSAWSGLRGCAGLTDAPGQAADPAVAAGG